MDDIIRVHIAIRLLRSDDLVDRFICQRLQRRIREPCQTVSNPLQPFRDIAVLKQSLAEIEARKEREVGNRSLFSACLVGYTNAGKSSLLNRLTKAEAFVEDRLFATLDTLTRRLPCGDGLEILISDTVGFIRRLPHHLVASFHATLEEASRADILIQVVDASDPLAAVQIDSVSQTLHEIGIADLPRVYALNKVDSVPNPGTLEALAKRFSPSFPVSAHTGEGVEALVAHLKARAEQGMRRGRLRLNAGDGRRFALLNGIAVVLDTVYEESDVLVSVLINPADLERIRRLPGRMKMEKA